MKEKIKRFRDICDCGRKVVGHHYLCDKCWLKKNEPKIKKEKMRRQTQREKTGRPQLMKHTEENNKLRTRLKKVKKQIRRLEKKKLDFGITMRPTNYFWTDGDEKKYRKNLKKCFICGKKIKTSNELGEVSRVFPAEPLLPRSFPVHLKCESEERGDFTISIK